MPISGVPVAASLFAVVYPQAPLFSENQNTKFLHSAAQSGHFPLLESDWTASTADPLPVFSGLIEPVFRWLPLQAFTLVFALLVALYAWSLARLACRALRFAPDAMTWWIFAALFSLLHFTSLDRALMEGLAHQYMLRHYLQPCVFGVFVLVAMNLALARHAIGATLCLVLATLVHPGAYLFVSVLILLGIVWHRLADEQLPLRRALAPVALFIVLMSPLAINQIILFAPTTEETWREAIRVLSTQRIPHHTEVASWLSASDVVKLVCVMWVCWRLRKEPLLFSMLVLMVAFVGFSSFVLLLFPDAAAGFSTPWRVSVVLVPLSMAVLAMDLSRVAAQWCARSQFAGKKVAAVAVALLAILGANALSLSERWQRERILLGSGGVLGFALRHAGAGQVYAVPPRDQSFDHFRLVTGLPIVANWKTHPYKDIEVLGRVHSSHI